MLLVYLKYINKTFLVRRNSNWRSRLLIPKIIGSISKTRKYFYVAKNCICFVSGFEYYVLINVCLSVSTLIVKGLLRFGLYGRVFKCARYYYIVLDIFEPIY